jgi:hypothetical protein
MKILSYEERDGKIIVRTNYKRMPEFVYRADKFKNIDSLKKEIRAKIRELDGKKLRRGNRKNKLKRALKKEVAKNARNGHRKRAGQRRR